MSTLIFNQKGILLTLLTFSKKSKSEKKRKKIMGQN
jgi:hypothetical protein